MAEKNSAQSILVWILLILVILGLGGFGVDGLLSHRVTSIGSIGDREISTQDYARALQNEMRAIEQQTGESMTLSQAQALGLDGRARSQLITQAALENEAERIGISVGDENVQRTVTSIDAFRGATGQFDMDIYRFALENVGQTASEFEDDVRRDSARGILQAATAAGIETPDNLRAALVDFYATRHSFDVFTVTEADLPNPVSTPTEAQVQTYYDANIAQFTAPETRSLSYVWLTPEMLLETVEVDENRIRELYDERIDTFVQPERRLVERLVYPDDAAAAEAMARFDAGEASFEDLVAERGLTLEEADMGDVSEQQLGAAGAALFALEEPGTVAGPLPSNLNRPAIYRMNAILNAQETPYEEARAQLRDELAGDAARRAITDNQETYEDLIAGGATLEDMANETPMVLGQIDWNPEVAEGIAAYSEFSAAALAISADDFPELNALSDGGLFALRLDGITPPAARPLEEVRDAATAGARAELVDAALMLHGQTLSADLAATDDIEMFSQTHGLNAERFEGVTRLDRLPQIPQAMLEQLMSGEPGSPVLNVGQQRATLALVEASEAPDTEDEQTQQLVQAIDEQVGNALAQDVFTYFAQALQNEAGIELDQAAINAVHANFR